MSRREGGREKGDSLAESIRHRALDLVRRLRGLARLVMREQGVDHLPPGDLETLSPFGLDTGRDQGRAEALVADLRERIESGAFLARAVRPGRVYCFRCESAECSHAGPADAEEIFTGYAPTGRPMWSDFISWCVDRRVPNIDRILAGGDMVLAQPVPGVELCRDQLDLFGGGNPRYGIMGQVAAGFFSLRRGDIPVRAAFSFLVIRVRGADGRPRLVLNPVGAVDFGKGADPPLADIIARSSRTLQLLSVRLEGMEKQGGGREARELVDPFLGALARDLEQVARSGYRRTGHARMRSAQGRRPTEMAYPDAREAMDEDLLVDTVESTLIVMGPKGRIHVFGRDGRHVTSMRYPGDALRRRLQTGRWRPADPPERGAFRAALRALEEKVTRSEGEAEGDPGGME